MLSFAVEDAKGKRLEKLPWKSLDAVALPVPSDFVQFEGGEFFGTRVSLSEGPWGHKFSGPGRYHLKAVVEWRAREWLEEGLRAREPSRKEIQFPLARVYQGKLSAEADVEVEGGASQVEPGAATLSRTNSISRDCPCWCWNRASPSTPDENQSKSLLRCEVTTSTICGS